MKKPDSLQENYDQKLKALKRRLTAFQKTHAGIPKSNCEKAVIVREKDIPFSPATGAFLFGEVLGFEMHVREMEKFHNVIFFSYKGQPCSYIDHKGCFTMSIPGEYRDEILETLRGANENLSEVLYLYAKIQIDGHQISLENRYKYYKSKLAWLEEQVETVQKKRLAEKCNKCVVTPEECEQMWEEYGERVCSFFDNEDDALCYSIDCYIDTFYSMIEHLFVLLTPFHPQYDPTIPEKKQPEAFKIRCKNWVTKAEALAFGDEEMLSCIRDLQYYKDIYRNFISHGMFSGESTILVPGAVSMFPVSVGDKYMQGLNGRKRTVLTYKDYQEIKTLFEKTLETIRQLYLIPMIFIEGTKKTPGWKIIPLKRENLMKGVLTAAQAEQKMDTLWERQIAFQNGDF